MAKKKDSNFTDEEMAELGIIDNQIGFDELEKPKRKTRTKSSKVEDKIEEIQEDEVEEIEDSESEDEESTIKPSSTLGSALSKITYSEYGIILS